MGKKRRGYKREAEIFKTLGHPDRLKILEKIMENECNVTEIWTSLKLPQATVSQHLALLRSRDIVESVREGVYICYKVTNKTVRRVMKLINE